MTLFAAALGLLSALVGVDAARRVGTRSIVHSVGWALAAALAWSTGAWSLHILHVESLGLGFPLGYQPIILLAGWLLGVLLALGGWLLAFFRSPNAWRLLAASVLLTSGLICVQALALMAPGFTPGPTWNATSVASASVGTWLACLGALLVYWTNREQHPLPRLRLPLAALLFAAALGWSQWQMASAAGLEQQVSASYADLLSIHALGLLARFGPLILLLMTLVTSLTEARMRESLQKAEGSLERHSQTDPLTGLPNRQYMEERLLDAAQRADQHRQRLVMMFIDLDGFKPINETFGHRFGDLLLCETASRLGQHADSGVEVARWAADEFLLLVDRDEDREAVAARARTLLDQLKRPFELEGREVPVAASIGIAIYPNDGAQSTLIAHADAAARTAKAAGGDTYCFFEPHMMRDAREQMELLRDLRHASDQGQLELYYQPKIHAPSGQITGAEALLRWNHPVRGLVSPVHFIPIAERFGLIGAIGNWVIEEACRQIRQWRDGGLRMRVAINLSVHQLRQHDLADRIAAALAAQEVNPRLLTCEITESAAMEDADHTKAFFQQLAAVGVHLSIDDFGTGYSSLSYLRQLPTEELKIDRSFIIDLENSSDARAVVDAVVKLGLALGLKVVAEGVETEAQYQILRQLGCEELQGYLFAKPMGAKMLYLWATMEKGPGDLDFRASLFGDTQIPPLDEDAVKP